MERVSVGSTLNQGSVRIFLLSFQVNTYADVRTMEIDYYV